MDTIEKNVIHLLDGKDAEETQDFCDFTLEDQNEAAGILSNHFHMFVYLFQFSKNYVSIVSKGQAPSAPPDFVPIIKQSVCYVVMAVIINEKNEILMMQEAKSTCAGQWYLPAGRVEPNESITVRIFFKKIVFAKNIPQHHDFHRMHLKEKFWKRQA